MKTLIIDNYDSFTYNLAHYFAEANQEEPVVVYNDAIDWAELAERDFDNIVISPGPGRPDRIADFGVSADAILKSDLPILGVCLGHQGVAALNGGEVKRAPEPMHGRLSRVWHSGDELFAGIPSPFEVVRYHSLLAARPLPGALTETAWTEAGLIMALRHRSRPVWGVQFHPESILTVFGRKLVENFRDLTRAVRPRRSVAMPRLVKPTARPKIEGPAPQRAAAPAPRLRAFWQQLPTAVDGEAAFCALYGKAPTAFWLDSSLVERGRARWSVMGDMSGPHARALSYDTGTGRLTIRSAAGTSIEQESIFDYLERTRPGLPLAPPPCPFVGGHVGWFGYELRNECGSPTVRRAPTPSAFFIRADRFLAIDHLTQRSYLVALAEEGEAAAADAWLAATRERLASLPVPSAPRLGSQRTPVRFMLDRDHDSYTANIERCLDLIGQGETYQVCLTNELVATLDLDPLELYRVMRKVNPAPHAAFLRWPGGAVLSASPERFLSVDRAGRVETKPIKGTIKRSSDPATDRALAERLASSEKDRAENLMIVDLLRNDLSRVCRPGSVQVPNLMAIESYATVHQLVTTVRGQLRAGASVIDLVRASFPGGSMTGAPKLRTLDFIDRLEQRARGVYSGALGWLGDDGAADLSIVIRTIVQTGNRLAMGIGGGIVAQSTPEGEFDEMLLKAKASIRAIVTAATGRFDEALYDIEGVDPSSAPEKARAGAR
jgi:para-aminobenzoate synthetase